MEFTRQQIAKAMKASSAEELLAMAKEDGIFLTKEEAEMYFAELRKPVELSDEELSAVAGGKGEYNAWLEGRKKAAKCSHFIPNWDFSVIEAYDPSAPKSCLVCHYFTPVKPEACWYIGKCGRK